MPSPSRSSSVAPALLHGPRPAPLKVSSPTTTGTAQQAVNKRRRLHQQRQPVIIYVESPRVVHAHPSEFKSVVQRLTGAQQEPMVSSSAPPPPPPQPPLQLQFPFQFQFPLAGASAASALLPPVTVAADATGSSSSVQGNLYSLLPPPSSSLAAASACYHQHQHHGGDLFIAHHQ